MISTAIFEMLAFAELNAGGELQLTDGLRQLLRKEKIYGYTFEGKRHDTGDRLGFLKATVEFRPQARRPGRRLPGVSEDTGVVEQFPG